MEILPSNFTKKSDLMDLNSLLLWPTYSTQEQSPIETHMFVNACNYGNYKLASELASIMSPYSVSDISVKTRSSLLKRSTNYPIQNPFMQF